jgi:hypothetical protein
MAASLAVGVKNVLPFLGRRGQVTDKSRFVFVFFIFFMSYQAQGEAEICFLFYV